MTVSLIPPAANLVAALMTMGVAAFVLLSEKGEAGMFDDEISAGQFGKVSGNVEALSEARRKDASQETKESTIDLQAALKLIRKGSQAYDQAALEPPESWDRIGTNMATLCTECVQVLGVEEEFYAKARAVADELHKLDGLELFHAVLVVADEASKACKHKPERARWCAQWICYAMADAGLSDAAEYATLKELRTYFPEAVLQHTPKVGGTRFCLNVAESE